MFECLFAGGGKDFLIFRSAGGLVRLKCPNQLLGGSWCFCTVHTTKNTLDFYRPFCITAEGTFSQSEEVDDFASMTLGERWKWTPISLIQILGDLSVPATSSYSVSCTSHGMPNHLITYEHAENSSHGFCLERTLIILAGWWDVFEI